MTNQLKRLNLELSAFCAYECVGCPNTYMDRKKGHMSPDLFEAIIDEVDGIVDRVFLWNYGEPLLNPNATRVLNYLSEKSTKATLSTTGYNFDSLKDPAALTKLDTLIVSINGFDEETYRFHQKGGALEKVLVGLENVAPYLIDSDVKYILQTVVNTQNVGSLDEADSFARKYGFSDVVIKSFNVMDNNEDTYNTFVPKGTEYDRANTPSRPDKIPCKEWMVINWNGDMNFCCWDYEGAMIGGNVKDAGVFGVWNSDFVQKKRNELTKGIYLPFCMDCTKPTTIQEWSVDK